MDLVYLASFVVRRSLWSEGRATSALQLEHVPSQSPPLRLYMSLPAVNRQDFDPLVCPCDLVL